MNKSVAIALFGLLTLSFGFSAQASPLTERFILGFSPDGARFAFATYETSDAADFASARVFVLDIASDTYVAGSPKLYGGEGSGLDTGPEALGALLADPNSPLRAAQIQIGNFRSLSTHNLGQDGSALSQSADIINFASPSFEVGELLITLEEIEMAGATMLDGIPCSQITGQEGKGFSLTFSRIDAQGVMIDGPRLAYRDNSVPQSRFCPMAYGLADVVTPFNSATGPTVALIRYFQMGFEGRAMNYLAVPVEQL